MISTHIHHILYNVDYINIISNFVIKHNVQFVQIKFVIFVQVYKIHRFGAFGVDNTPNRCYNKDTEKDKESPKNRKGKLK